MAYSKAERLTLMLKFISLESALLSGVVDDFALKLFSEQRNFADSSLTKLLITIERNEPF